MEKKIMKKLLWECNDIKEKYMEQKDNPHSYGNAILRILDLLEEVIKKL